MQPSHQEAAATDLGVVSLLELNQVPSGKRLAYCLPSGEFIFVCTTCAPEFGASQPADLYGGNLFQFLPLLDTEKLEDFLRACQRARNSSAHGSHTFDSVSQLRMAVHLVGGRGAPTWIRLSTVPLTLRLMRCIDAVRNLSSALGGHFADSSSFVLSEDEFGSVCKTHGSTASPVSPGYDASLSLATDFMLLDCEGDNMSPANWTSIVPLELKHQQQQHPNRVLRASSRFRHPEDDSSEEDADDEDLKASLANYAFEADWDCEVRQDQVASASLVSDGGDGSMSSASSGVTRVPTKLSFRAKAVF